MNNDPNPELRAELNAALSVVMPQLRGLQNFVMIDEFSPETDAVIKASIVNWDRRKTLINAVIAALDAVVVAMDALEADGYPTPVSASPTAGVVAEIQQFEDDLVSGAAVLGVILSTPDNQALIDKIDAGIKANTASLSAGINPKP